MSSIAFVLGNGQSRKGIDINDLKEKGTVYACNAVYRTHQPHWLVAVVAYPVLGAWAAFTAFVKFAFVVFALNTLAGFEDFDSPGWLLG